MTSDVLLGLLLGGALGFVHVAVGRVLWIRARRRPDSEFYKLVLGGLIVRFFLLLTAVAAVLYWLPLAVFPFIGALFVAFVVGLALEVIQMARRPAHPRDPSP